MNSDLLLPIGGVGLFLLGMLILTDGLKRLAGDSLRNALSQFTKNPISGAATGALVTALVQSSSATTVTTIGLVGAGIITFSQALSIVFGAAVGTTATGWLVAGFGFKLKLEVAVLPLVLIGVLLRMFAQGRLANFGLALAGFSLLFIGIDSMQRGLVAFEGIVTPDILPDDTLVGRLQLVLIGIAITLVLQSSSAGVVGALVAMSAGTIALPQAAAMVIGMSVGTTFTAALATFGGSTAMRRTGYAHVIHNVATSVLAFALLDLFMTLARQWISSAGDEQLALVAFHTAFSALGVVLFLPFSEPFARLVIRFVPERGPMLTNRLDERLLTNSTAAVDAATATIRMISFELFAIVTELLDPNHERRTEQARLQTVNEALEETRLFIERIRTGAGQTDVHQRHLAVMHALDHLNRLNHRCTQGVRIAELRGERRLRRLSGIFRSVIGAMTISDDLEAFNPKINKLRTVLRRQQRIYREYTIAKASQQSITTQKTLVRLDSVRWLHRSAYHVWRIVHYLNTIEKGLPGDEESYDRSMIALEEE